MTMMEDRLPRWAWEAPIPYLPETPPPPAIGGGAWGDLPSSPPGFNIERPPQFLYPESPESSPPEYGARGGTYPTPTEMPVQQQPYIMPAGEMIGERMEWDSPYQNTMREEMDRGWKDFYGVPPFVPSPAELADIGRTTTMGTGWGRQPLIDPPPTYDYTGTGGLGGLSPSIPFANTLMPPAGQEMMGNWGGGAANRQEWAGPLVDPFMSPWSGGEMLLPFGGNPMLGDPIYNTMNPDWYGVMEARKADRFKDVGNFATNYGLPLGLAAMTLGGSLPFYNPWDYNPFDSRIPRFR